MSIRDQQYNIPACCHHACDQPGPDTTAQLWERIVDLNVRIERLRGLLEQGIQDKDQNERCAWKQLVRKEVGFQ